MAISTTRLVILGGVLTFEPVHGYLLRRELSSWHPEHWANLKPGSIYNALGSLTREGFLEALDEAGAGARPARTRYRLTDEGRAEFFRLLRESLRTVSPLGGDAVAAAWTFAWTLPRQEVVELLEARRSALDAQVSALAATAAAASDDPSVPDHVRELSRLLAARLDGERSWVVSLLPQLRGGAYRFADNEGTNEPTHSQI